MKSRTFLLSVSVLVFLLISLVGSSFASSVPRMSTDELNSRLSEDGLVILDVRSSYHWGASDKKILSSTRVVPSAFADWASNYDKEDTIVLYCA